MGKQTHTPTPWEVQDCRHAGANVVSSDGNAFVARMAHGDAAFIVAACNAHDELVAALRKCEHALQLSDISSARREHVEMARRMARAALAKVGS